MIEELTKIVSEETTKGSLPSYIRNILKEGLNL